MSETSNTTKEAPAYRQMEQKLGEAGIAMLDEQLALYAQLNERTLFSPLRESIKNGNPTLPEGTLLHGMGMHGFSQEAVRSVAEKGIISGELIGMAEDAETHGCADFFRVAHDTTVPDYMTWTKRTMVTSNETGRKQHTQKGERLLTRGIAFIVDAQAEGMEALLEKDGYRDDTMSDFVNPPTSRSPEDTAAILGGVPGGAIAGIIATDKFLEKDGVRELLTECFPETPVLNHEGQLQLATAAN